MLTVKTAVETELILRRYPAFVNSELPKIIFMSTSLASPNPVQYMSRPWVEFPWYTSSKAAAN